jgi:phenylalanyl-tRNA synthetase alpha chain
MSKEFVSLISTTKFSSFMLNGGEVTPSKNNHPVEMPPCKISSKSSHTSEKTLEISVSEIEQAILGAISKDGEIPDTWHFAAEHCIDHNSLVGVLKSLLADNYICDEVITSTFWTLTTEGQSVKVSGSPEIQVMRALSTEGSTMATLQTLLGGDVVKIGLGVCMKNKWVQKAGEVLKPIKFDVVDETVEILTLIELGTASEEDFQKLKKRKLTQQVTRKSYKLTKGLDFREQRVRKVADLNKFMLGNKVEVW